MTTNSAMNCSPPCSDGEEYSASSPEREGRGLAGGCCTTQLVVYDLARETLLCCVLCHLLVCYARDFLCVFSGLLQKARAPSVEVEHNRELLTNAFETLS